MEKTNKINPLRIVGFSIGLFVSALIILHTILTLKAPLKSSRELASFYLATNNDSIIIEIPDSLLYLAEEKAILQSRLEMSAYDSISLELDLPDSTLHLNYKGFSLHSTRYSSIDIPGFLKNIDPQVLVAITARPARVSLSEASIEHEPIVVKKAPKDTIEAAQMVSVPDTLNREAVTFTYRLENGINLRFVQDSINNPEEKGKISSFTKKKRYRDLWASVKYSLTFRIPPYNPEIVFYLPEEDAKSIYRAMPKNGMVTLRIGIPVEN
jgi:hypothetical protein